MFAQKNIICEIFISYREKFHWICQNNSEVLMEKFHSPSSSLMLFESFAPLAARRVNISSSYANIYQLII